MPWLFNIKPTFIRSHKLRPTFTGIKSNSCVTALWPSNSHFEALHPASFYHHDCQAVKLKMLPLMSTLRASPIKPRNLSSVLLNVVEKQSPLPPCPWITGCIQVLWGLIPYQHSLMPSSQIKESNSRLTFERCLLLPWQTQHNFVNIDEFLTTMKCTRWQIPLCALVGWIFFFFLCVCDGGPMNVEAQVMCET